MWSLEEMVDVLYVTTLNYYMKQYWLFMKLPDIRLRKISHEMI